MVLSDSAPPASEKGLRQHDEGKKPYRRPRLQAYGDLRDLTLGPSPGIGESGNPAIFRVS